MSVYRLESDLKKLKEIATANGFSISGAVAIRHVGGRDEYELHASFSPALKNKEWSSLKDSDTPPPLEDESYNIPF